MNKEEIWAAACSRRVADPIMMLMIMIIITRPKPAFGRQGLDWIVRPGNSFVVVSTNRGILTSFGAKT